MVQIKKFVSQPVYAKPIGVVQPSTGPVREAEALTNAGQALASNMIKYAISEEQRKGRDYKYKIQTRDEDGNLITNFVPDHLSKVALEEAQPYIDKAYESDFVVSLGNKALEIRRKYNQTLDAQSFTNEYNAYIEETKKLAPRYANFIEAIGAKTNSEHYNDLLLKKTEQEFSNQFKSEYKSIDEALGAMRSFSQNVYSNADIPSTSPVADMLGENVISPDTIRVTNQAIEDQVKQLESRIAEFGKRYASILKNNSQLLPKLYNQLHSNIATGRTNIILEHMSNNDAFYIADGAASRKILFKQLQNVVSLGSSSNLENAKLLKTYLKKHNLDLSWVDTIKLSEESRKKLSSHIATFGNSVSEIDSSLKKTIDNQDALERAADGTATKEDAKNILEQYKLTNPKSILEDLNRKESIVLQILGSNVGELPDSLKQIFTEDGFRLAKIANEQNVLLDAFNTATVRVGTNGKISRLKRGIEDKDFFFLQQLNFVKEQTPMNVEEFFDKYTAVQNLDQSAKDIILMKAFSVDDAKKIDRELNKLTGDDVDFNLFYREQIKQYALVNPNFNEIKELSKVLKNKIFVTSKFFANPNQRSSLAPETFYADEKEFTNHIQLIMNNNGILIDDQGEMRSRATGFQPFDTTKFRQPRIGKDIFLVPTGISRNPPAYFLVDKNNKVILNEKSQAIKVGGLKYAFKSLVTDNRKKRIALYSIADKYKALNKNFSKRGLGYTTSLTQEQMLMMNSQ